MQRHKWYIHYKKNLEAKSNSFNLMYKLLCINLLANLIYKTYISKFKETACCRKESNE